MRVEWVGRMRVLRRQLKCRIFQALLHGIFCGCVCVLDSPNPKPILDQKYVIFRLPIFKPGF